MTAAQDVTAAPTPDVAVHALTATSDPHALVSVIVPCFNVGGFLVDAVERLLAQTYPALEVVLVDDASTDDSRQIAADLDARFPNVRTFLMSENAGVAAARETGVRVANGSWVWFVDADDTWPETAISEMMSTALAQDADVVCAGARVVSESGSRPVGRIAEETVVDAAAATRALLRGAVTGHLWNKLFRRDALRRISFTRIRQHSDQAMVVQALAAANRVALTPTAVYEYRLRQGSIIRSGSRRADSLRTLGRVVEDAVARQDATALRSPAYRYYRARYSVLSRLKDATSGAYPADERRVLIRTIRADMSVGDLWALVRAKDPVRTALYVLGWVSPAGYGMLLDRAGGRL